uniref:Uncharacterized protein n=1 Tax=Tetranychus urticae TaxID=32264 RepID=T1KJQ7_TETUR
MSLSRIIFRGTAINARGLATATDSIQKLFLDKISEFKKKGDFIESDAQANALMKAEMERIANQFGVKKDEEDKITFKSQEGFKLEEPIKIQYDN